MNALIFQDRRFQPLTHPSVFNSNVFCELAVSLLRWRFELLHSGAGSEPKIENRTQESREKFR
jgi:hypothetical protein